jgi:hypothetical protein
MTDLDYDFDVDLYNPNITPEEFIDSFGDFAKESATKGDDDYKWMRDKINSTNIKIVAVTEYLVKALSITQNDKTTNQQIKGELNTLYDKVNRNNSAYKSPLSTGQMKQWSSDYKNYLKKNSSVANNIYATFAGWWDSRYKYTMEASLDQYNAEIKELESKINMVQPYFQNQPKITSFLNSKISEIDVKQREITKLRGEVDLFVRVALNLSPGEYSTMKSILNSKLNEILVMPEWSETNEIVRTIELPLKNFREYKQTLSNDLASLKASESYKNLMTVNEYFKDELGKDKRFKKLNEGIREIELKLESYNKPNDTDIYKQNILTGMEQTVNDLKNLETAILNNNLRFEYIKNCMNSKEQLEKVINTMEAQESVLTQVKNILETSPKDKSTDESRRLYNGGQKLYNRYNTTKTDIQEQIAEKGQPYKYYMDLSMLKANDDLKKLKNLEEIMLNIKNLQQLDLFLPRSDTNERIKKLVKKFQSLTHPDKQPPEQQTASTQVAFFFNNRFSTKPIKTYIDSTLKEQDQPANLSKLPAQNNTLDVSKSMNVLNKTYGDIVKWKNTIVIELKSRFTKCINEQTRRHSELEEYAKKNKIPLNVYEFNYKFDDIKQSSNDKILNSFVKDVPEFERLVNIQCKMISDIIDKQWEQAKLWVRINPKPISTTEKKPETTSRLTNKTDQPGPTDTIVKPHNIKPISTTEKKPETTSVKHERLTNKIDQQPGPTDTSVKDPNIKPDHAAQTEYRRRYLAMAGTFGLTALLFYMFKLGSRYWKKRKLQKKLDSIRPKLMWMYIQPYDKELNPIQVTPSEDNTYPYDEVLEIVRNVLNPGNDLNLIRIRKSGKPQSQYGFKTFMTIDLLPEIRDIVISELKHKGLTNSVLLKATESQMAKNLEQHRILLPVIVDPRPVTRYVHG